MGVVVMGFRRWVSGGGGGGSGGGWFGGSGEHLDDLFEGGSVSLDEGGRVGVGRFGSGDGFRGEELRRRRRWRSWVAGKVGGRGAAAAAGTAVAVRGREEGLSVVGIMVLL
ncbi:hypothetical protein M5689_008828 [Euphorbia peplus]|nr:hypothetical protein M5689_008828 [Euphorbia peplus]